MSNQELHLEAQNSQDRTLSLTDLDQTMVSSDHSSYMTVHDNAVEFIDELSSHDLSQTFGPSVFNDLTDDEIVNDTRFEVRRVLGQGAFGEVYGAQDSDLNRRVALKQFKGEMSQAIEACRNEVRFVGRLEHPGIPPVYQVSKTIDGFPYIVMKQLEGEPLSDIISQLKSGDLKAHAHYSFRARIELIIQLLRIVESAHQSGILHLDIKPDNIYLGEHDELYLIDWGISEEREVAKNRSTLCGTPLYMSPEQSQAKPLDVTSDIFSVGAVAYELLSLESCAPQEKSLADLLEALPTFQPKVVDLHYNAIQGYSPSEFKTPIMKSIKRAPADRYQSTGEMRYDLEQALDGNFLVKCPRTLIKMSINRLFKWLDRRLRNVMLIYALILTFLISLLSLGALIGRAFG